MANGEVSTYTSVANASSEGRLDIDVSPVIWHLAEPTDTPLNTLVGGDLYSDGKSTPTKVAGKIKKEVALETSYKVIEKNPLARTWVGGAAVADTTTTTVPMVNAAGIQAGMLLRAQNQAAPEVLLVITYTSSTSLECRRNLGSTAYTIAAGTTFVCIGFASKQGGSKRSIRAQLADPRTRYAQIFKNTYGISGSLDQSKLVVDINAWDEEMKQAGREHQMDKEYAFWFNAAADSSTDSGSNTVYMTRGIIAELMTDSECYTNANGTFDEDFFFNTVLANAFKYGPSRKTLFADAELLGRIDKWARDRLKVHSDDNDYGLAITELISVHGTVEIVHAGNFGQVLSTNESCFGVFLDLDRVVYKYMQKRDSQMTENTQTPGDDVREATLLSEVGLSLRSLKHHHVVGNKLAGV